MAMADYRLCDVCDCKTFYDAELQYDFKRHPGLGLYRLGAWAVLCTDCAKTHTIEIIKSPAKAGGEGN